MNNNKTMLRDDFSVETVELNGYPIKTFKARHRSLREMFRESVSVYENKVYLSEGENQLTYRQAGDMAVGLAVFLREELGVRRGDHIGLLMENSIPNIIAFWAVQELGAVGVLFNTQLAPPELKRQLEFSDLKALLVTASLSKKVEESSSHVFGFRQIVFGDDWRKYIIDAKMTTPTGPEDELDEDDMAVILYTSGTGGIPKGVMLSHRSQITGAFKVGNIYHKYPKLRDSIGTATMIAAPIFHVLGLQSLMLPAVFIGHECVLMKAFKPQEFLDLCIKHHVTYIGGSPTMHWMLLNKTNMKEVKDKLNFRLFVYGGAPMPPDLLKDIRSTFPGIVTVNGYGATEGSNTIGVYDEWAESHPTSVGKPNPCSEVKIENLYGKECEPGEIGEVAFRGANVALGYYKNPEETAKVFRNGWMYTGDQGYRDADGFYYLVGRVKEMINRGGENVYPVEVENVLALHPKTLSVSIFGLPDPVMGSIVACAIIPRPGEERITVDEIKEFCRDQLAHYKIPQKIFFVEDLPRNAGGKVIKAKLIEQFKGA